MIWYAQYGDLQASLSLVDLFVYLYWRVLAVFPDNPSCEERDRFVLGGGNSCPTLYATLARRGFFSHEELWNYGSLGAILQAYPDVRRTPGVDAPSGVRGMGIGIALGMAHVMVREQSPGRVFCVLEEKEMQQGTFWDTLYSRSPYPSNLLVLGIASEPERDITSMWRSFGWDVESVDGHDFEALEAAFSDLLSSGSQRRGLVVMVRDNPLLKGDLALPLTQERMERILEELS